MGRLRQTILPLSIRIKDFKHELLNRLRSTMAVNVLRMITNQLTILDFGEQDRIVRYIGCNMENRIQY